MSVTLCKNKKEKHALFLEVIHYKSCKNIMNKTASLTY